MYDDEASITEIAAMLGDGQGVNWLGAVLSSAVVGAGVNALSVIWTRRIDRQREDAARAERQGYAMLNIALELEAFGQRASAYLYAVERACHEYRNHNLNRPLKYLSA
ncbi:hypothetical protein [Burkholderia gladioli]|uniref:hypothetical protein n=1 Tax=Burkholderia gladioli TaxID=28095 RepID=UPI003D22806D